MNTKYQIEERFIMAHIDEMENKLDDMTKFFIFSQEELKSEIDAMLKMVSSNINKIADAEETIKNNELMLHEKDEALKTTKLKNEEQIVHLMATHKSGIEKIEVECQNRIHTLENIHNILKEKLEFTDAILSAKSTINKYLLDFDIIVNNDFLKFSNTNRYNAQDAQSLLKLNDLKRELENFVLAPDIYNKSTIAIMGGEESGKSQLINSFFKSTDIELPKEYDPSYTIPTYIIYDTKSAIEMYNKNGGIIEIDKKFYYRLSCDHIRSFTFNLEDIVPFVLIRTPLNEKYFKNLTLVDIQEFDLKSENQRILKYVDNPNITSILWVINANVNFTIPASDLEFLKSHQRDEKKVYIVVNVFKESNKSELESRLSNMKNTLSNNGVSFSGISAYCPDENKEYRYVNRSLFDFIKEQNRPLLTQENMILKIQDIFDKYKSIIKENLKNIDSVDKQFDLLALDLKEDGLEDENGIVSLRLSILRKLCKDKELKDDLKRVDILQNKFIATINKIFGRDITL